MSRHCLALSLVVACSTAPAGEALAGGLICLHWHTAKADLVNWNQPVGSRGWDLETFLNVSEGPGHWAFDASKKAAQAAAAAGLRLIFRLDYNSSESVPKAKAQYKSWADDFIQRSKDLGALGKLFVVGNEPPLSNQIGAQSYADAFNYLYARKNEMPPGSELLAAGPNFHCCPWVNGLTWLSDMASALVGVDGFALHTYHAPGECGADPSKPCENVASWPGDDGFRNYRDQIDITRKKWPEKPIYLTETNTDTNGLGISPDPRDNYPAGWFAAAYADIRDYNATTASDPSFPQVLALCWFVDRNQAPWGPFSLDAQQGKMALARQELIAAAQDPRNYAIPTKSPALAPDAAIVSDGAADGPEGAAADGATTDGAAVDARADAAIVIKTDGPVRSRAQDGCAITDSADPLEALAAIFVLLLLSRRRSCAGQGHRGLGEDRARRFGRRRGLTNWFHNG